MPWAEILALTIAGWGVGELVGWPVRTTIVRRRKRAVLVRERCKLPPPVPAKMPTRPKSPPRPGAIEASIYDAVAQGLVTVNEARATTTVWNGQRAVRQQIRAGGKYCATCETHGHLPYECPQRDHQTVVTASGRVKERKAEVKVWQSADPVHIEWGDSRRPMDVIKRCVYCKSYNIIAGQRDHRTGEHSCLCGDCRRWSSWAVA